MLLIFAHPELRRTIVQDYFFSLFFVHLGIAATTSPTLPFIGKSLIPLVMPPIVQSVTDVAGSYYPNWKPILDEANQHITVPVSVATSFYLEPTASTLKTFAPLILAWAAKIPFAVRYYNYPDSSVLNTMNKFIDPIVITIGTMVVVPTRVNVAAVGLPIAIGVGAYHCENNFLSYKPLQDFCKKLKNASPAIWGFFVGSALQKTSPPILVVTLRSIVAFERIKFETYPSTKLLGFSVAPTTIKYIPKSAMKWLPSTPRNTLAGIGQGAAKIIKSFANEENVTWTKALNTLVPSIAKTVFEGTFSYHWEPTYSLGDGWGKTLGLELSWYYFDDGITKYTPLASSAGISLGLCTWHTVTSFTPVPRLALSIAIGASIMDIVNSSQTLFESLEITSFNASHVKSITTDTGVFVSTLLGATTYGFDIIPAIGIATIASNIAHEITPWLGSTQEAKCTGQCDSNES
jgi:hypothetical protein